MDTVGRRIKHVRRLLSLSQEAFAKLLSSSARKQSVTRGAVGNWEHDKGIKTQNLILIADMTGASTDWLARREGPDPTSKEDLSVRISDAKSIRGDRRGMKHKEDPRPSKYIAHKDNEDLAEIVRLLESLDSEELSRAKTIIFAAFADKTPPRVPIDKGGSKNSGKGADG